MTRIYKKRSDPRIPPAIDGLQLNTCRNPHCSNFGIPPKDHVPRGRQLAEARDTYVLQSNKKRPNQQPKQSISCLLCGEQFRMIGNVGVREELDRFLAYIAPKCTTTCPTESCQNHSRDVESAPDGYIRYGETPKGAQRYQCRLCKKTFSVSPHIGRQLRQPEKSALVFSLLVNKSPMRRICEVAGINAVTLYQRIDLIYKCCLRVAQKYEAALLAGKKYDRLHIAVDRQEHTFNWGTQFDRRLVILKAIASAEAKSGYVLAQHLNFDPTFDPQEVELDARECGDINHAPPYRKYARFWLKADYQELKNDEDAIDETFASDAKLPARGLQVFETYSLFSHFLFLERLLKGVSEIQFSLDREASIQPACLLAFRDWVAREKLDVFLIRIDKFATVERRKLALSHAAAKLSRFREKNSQSSEIDAAIEMLKQEHEKATASFRHQRDRWVDHPLPNMNEPQKSMLCVTAKAETDASRLAWGYMRASLNTIDRYFMQVRRRISILERPISSSSNNNRRWYGYQAYNPEVGMKMLEIFRVVYNYHLVGHGKMTPAQRMGLVDRALSLEEILKA